MHFSQIFLYLIATFIFLGSGLATAAPWKADPKHTFVNFTVQHLGILPCHGRFKRAEIELDYNPVSAESSSVKAKILIASLETDDGLMNQILTGEQFFNMQSFPYMTFTSTSIRRSSLSTGFVDGNLELMGKIRPVTFNARFNGEAKNPFNGTPIIGIEAETVIKRREWGLAAWRGYVSDDVKIKIAFEASPK